MNLLYAGVQDVSVRFTSACQARQKSEARKQRRERELLLAKKVAAEVAAGMAKGKVANAVRPGGGSLSSVAASPSPRADWTRCLQAPGGPDAIKLPSGSGTAKSVAAGGTDALPGEAAQHFSTVLRRSNIGQRVAPCTRV
jgi:hypothetical protein